MVTLPDLAHSVSLSAINFLASGVSSFNCLQDCSSAAVRKASVFGSNSSIVFGNSYVPRSGSIGDVSRLVPISSIARKPRGIERSNVVPVQRSQHADPGMHHEVATFGSTDQAANRRLPDLMLLLGFRHCGAVKGGSIHKRDQLLAAGLSYRFRGRRR